MKRFLAIFLTVMMMVNIMPIGAFADTQTVLAPDQKTEEPAAPATSPEAAPATSPEVAPATSPEVAPATSPEVAPATSPEVAPATSPEVAPATSPEVAPATSPEAAPATSPEVAPATSPIASSNAPRGLMATDFDIEEEITLEVGKTVELTAGNSKAEWSVVSGDADNVSLSATQGKKITVTAEKVGVVIVKSDPISGGKDDAYYRIEVIAAAPAPTTQTVSFFVRTVRELPQNPSQGGAANEYMPSAENHSVQGTVSIDIYNQILDRHKMVSESGLFGNGEDPSRMAVPSDLSQAGVASNQKVIWYLAQYVAGNKNDIHVDGYIAGEEVDIEYVANFPGADPSKVGTKAITGTAITIEDNFWQNRDGYTFLGWSGENNATVADANYAPNTVYTPQTSVRLFAVWSKNPDPTATYEVEHYTESLKGEYVLVDTQEFPETVVGTKVTATVSSKVSEGFTAPETMPTGEIVKDGSLVIKVYYTRNSYKLNFVVKDKTITNNYKFGEDLTGVTAPDTTPDVSENFKGWDGKIPATMPAANVTITAKFATKANAQFWFYSNKDGVPVQNTAIASDVNKEVGDLLGLTKEAIEAYAKAQIDGRNDVKYTSFQVVQEDEIIYDTLTSEGDTDKIALTKSNSTRIHVSYEFANKVIFNYFIVKDGIIANYGTPSAQDNVFIGDTVTTNKGTAPRGYAFDKATKTDGTLVGDTYLYEKMVDSTINVYYNYDDSQWFSISYNANAPVGFVLKGEVSKDSSKYLGGADATVLSENTLEMVSHQFLGWSKDVNATAADIKADTKLSVTANTTLYAVWQINQYDITFKFGNSESKVVKTNYGEMPVAPENPVKEATVEYTYTFAGWDKTVEAATGKETYTAKYDAKAVSYNVSYEYVLPLDIAQEDIDAGKTTPPATTSHEFYSSVIPAQGSDLQGYNFLGWTIKGSTDGKLYIHNMTMPAENVTLVGTWTKATGTTNYTETYYDEELPGVPYDLEQDGRFYRKSERTFKATVGDKVNGNKKAANGFTYVGNMSTPNATVTADGKAQITMFFNRLSATVTYKYEGAKPADAPKLPTKAEYKYGTEVSVSALAEDAVAGYTFNGWELDGKKLDSTFRMGTKSVKLVGNWTENADTKYEVHYYYQNLDGEEFTLAQAETQQYEDKTNAKVNPTIRDTKLGFALSDKSELKGTVKADGSLVLTAYYTRSTYPISYYLDGVVYSSSAARFGASISPLAAPSVAGRTFSGWSAIPTTMPASPVNVYGSTTAIPAPVVPDEPVPAGPTPPVTPVAPVTPPAPPVVIPDPAVPEGPTPAPSPTPVAPVVIPDDDIPQGPGITSPAWALVNLILAVATAITSIVLLAGYYMGKKKNEEQGVYEDEETLKRKGFYRLASLIPTIGAIVMFILTENIANPMIMTDKWTVMMLCIALVQVAVCLFCKKADKKEENKGDANA